ncbi:hypothetical protein D3C71_2032890 [compost metagenome]
MNGGIGSDCDPRNAAKQLENLRLLAGKVFEFQAGQQHVEAHMFGAYIGDKNLVGRQ